MDSYEKIFYTPYQRRTPIWHPLSSEGPVWGPLSPTISFRFCLKPELLVRDYSAFLFKDKFYVYMIHSFWFIYIYIYWKKSWECICRTFLGLKERWRGIFSARAVFYQKSLSKNERKVKARMTRVIKKMNLFIPIFDEKLSCHHISQEDYSTTALKASRHFILRHKSYPCIKKKAT